MTHLRTSSIPHTDPPRPSVPSHGPLIPGMIPPVTVLNFVPARSGSLVYGYHYDYQNPAAEPKQRRRDRGKTTGARHVAGSAPAAAPIVPRCSTPRRGPPSRCRCLPTPRRGPVTGSASRRPTMLPMTSLLDAHTGAPGVRLPSGSPPGRRRLLCNRRTTAPPRRPRLLSPTLRTATATTRPHRCPSQRPTGTLRSPVCRAHGTNDQPASPVNGSTVAPASTPPSAPVSSESHRAAGRVAHEDGTVDSRVVEHREHVGDVLLDPVLLEPGGTVAAAVTPVVEDEVPVRRQRGRVLRAAPHPSVATTARVPEHAGAGTGVGVVQPYAVSLNSRHDASSSRVSDRRPVCRLIDRRAVPTTRPGLERRRARESRAPGTRTSGSGTGPTATLLPIARTRRA